MFTIQLYKKKQNKTKRILKKLVRQLILLRFMTKTFKGGRANLVFILKKERVRNNNSQDNLTSLV